MYRKEGAGMVASAESHLAFSPLGDTSLLCTRTSTRPNAHPRVTAACSAARFPLTEPPSYTVTTDIEMETQTVDSSALKEAIPFRRGVYASSQAWGRVFQRAYGSHFLQVAYPPMRQCEVDGNFHSLRIQNCIIFPYFRRGRLE